MIEITKYQARDEKVFDTKEACIAHENMLSIVDVLQTTDVYERETSFEEVVTELLKHYTIHPL